MTARAKRCNFVTGSDLLKRKGKTSSPGLRRVFTCRAKEKGYLNSMTYL